MLMELTMKYQASRRASTQMIGAMNPFSCCEIRNLRPNPMWSTKTMMLAAVWTSAFTAISFCNTCHYIIAIPLDKNDFLLRCLSVGYNPYTGECRLSRFDESSARLVFDPNFNYYRNIEGKNVCFIQKHNCCIIEFLVDQDGRLYYAGYEGAYRPRKSNANGNGGFNYGPPVVLPSARPPFKPLPPTPRPRPPSRRPSVDQPPFMSYPDTVDTTPPNQIPQVVTTSMVSYLRLESHSQNVLAGHSNSVIQKDVRYSNCDDNEDNFRQVRINYIMIFFKNNISLFLRFGPGQD